MEHLEEIKYIFIFPYDFKEAQLLCLQTILQNKDLIAILPTGYGKSILFQMAPYLIHASKGQRVDFQEMLTCALVLTPLNSIMKDQLADLCKIGIPACAIDYTYLQAETFVTEKANSISEDEDEDEDQYEAGRGGDG